MNFCQFQRQSKFGFILLLTFQRVLLHLELSEVVTFVAVIFVQIVKRPILLRLHDVILHWRFVVWAWSNFLTLGYAGVLFCHVVITDAAVRVYRLKSTIGIGRILLA